MSYINDALRKAEREKDSRYRPFSGILSAPSDGSGRPRRRIIVPGAAIGLAILMMAVLLVAVYALQPFSGKKGSPSPTVAGNQESVNPSTVGESGPASAEPAGASSTEAVRGSVPPEPAGGGREAEARYGEALGAHRRGDLKGAEELYGRTLALAPGHVRAMNNLGVILMEKKDRERAIALFNRAIVAKKDYVDPYYNLACLYAQANEIEESLRYLRIAVTLDPDVKNWAAKDADMKIVVATPAFKKIMEGQKN